MGSVRGAKGAGRAQWLTVFTVLLLVSSVAPVLAESPPDEPEVPVPSAAETQDWPDGADVAKGIEESEALEAEEQRLLETSWAAREREESRLAYTDLSVEDAAALLRSEFAEQLALIDQDPARALTGAQLKDPLGSTRALIDIGGDTVLMDGTMPVRATDEEGRLRKVSLELRHVGEDGYAPANPLTEIELPRDASEPMTIGKSGLAIAPVIPKGEAEAHRFGETDLLYPLPKQDMDLLAAPLSSGLELFASLRSEKSPEELRFDLTLPPGGELRPDGRGGLEVRGEEGRSIASIPAPTAVDAQGTEVPVSMHAEGTTLTVSIKHRGMDVKFPLLLDPAISDSWYSSNSWYNGGSLAALSDGTWHWAHKGLGYSPVAATGLRHREGSRYSECSRHGLLESRGPGFVNHYGFRSQSLPIQDA